MSSNKLELKHLAPYLPYELKVYCRSSNKKIQDLSYDKLSDGKIEHMNKWEHKLILRPLSDLTKEITHNGEIFYPYEKLHLCYSDVVNFLNEDLWIGQWRDYEKVSKLFEWHFDVFGLIEQGLAIDINTIYATQRDQLICVYCGVNPIGGNCPFPKKCSTKKKIKA